MKKNIHYFIILSLSLITILISSTSLAWDASAQVSAYNYTADLQGMPASAQVSFEPLREYVLMSGVITSRVARYTFTANITGSEGFGSMLDHSTGDRIRIKIVVRNNGSNFTIILNPFGGATSYHFRLSN